MSKKGCLILIVILYCSSLNSFAGETSFIAKFNAIVFEGNITEEDYLKFKKIVEENPNVKNLGIASGGGNALAAMAMGKLIKLKELNVRIVGGCASACANYLFVAGNKKILQRNAALFFHGGFQQDGMLESIKLANSGAEIKAHGATFFDDGKDAPPDYLLNALGIKKVGTVLEAFPQLVEIEKKYFVEMKVSTELPTYGQKGIYKDIWESKKYEFFYYDIESLERLGIKNIEVEGGEWRPEENPFNTPAYKVKYP